MKKNEWISTGVEHVGQFMFPDALEQARALHSEGSIDDEALRKAEDKAISDVVEKQRQAGIKAITDGELRRSSWDLDFFTGLNGVEKKVVTSGHIWEDTELGTPVPEIIGEISYNENHPFFHDFEFLMSKIRPDETARISLPAPAHILMWLIANFPDLKIDGGLVNQIALAFNASIRRFYELGCRSVLLRDTSWGTFCDTDRLKRVLQGGIDPLVVLPMLHEINDKALEGLPDDMERILFVHTDCKPNSAHSATLYSIIVEKVFAHKNVSAFMADYGTAYNFIMNTDKRFPSDKGLILGVVGVHYPQLEDEDHLRECIDVVLGRISPVWLRLSPSDGFKVNHSVIDTSAFTEDDQWRKLAIIADFCK